MLRWNEIGKSSSFEVEVEIESERWLELGERFGECREVSGGCVATEEKEDVAPSVL